MTTAVVPGWVRRCVRVVSAVVGVAAGLMIIYLVYAGWLYPLRPDTIAHLSHPFAPAFGPGTWGGPTLAGAWAAHAGIAVGIQAVCLGLVLLGRAGWRSSRPRAVTAAG